MAYRNRQARSRAVFIAKGGAAPAFAYNFDGSFLSRWRAKRNAVIDGSAYAKIACWGDSKTRGYGAGTGTGTAVQQGGTNSEVGSYPYLLAAALPGSNKGRSDSFFGTGQPFDFNNDGASNKLDSALMYGNVTFSSGVTTANLALGGMAFIFNSSGDNLVYTPRSSADTFDVYYQRSSGGTTFTVSDTSGTLATIDTSGASANGFLKQTVTRASASTGPITLTSTGTGTVQIVGVDAYSSASKATRVFNFGAIGTTVTNQTSANTLSISPINAIKVVAPDLTIINLATNDIEQGIAVATYKANIQAMVTAAQISGDVVLAWPSAAANKDPAVRAPYRQAMLEVAQASNCVMMDWSDLMVALGARNVADNTAGASAATYFFDGSHETKAGYQAEANALLPLLAA